MALDVAGMLPLVMLFFAWTSLSNSLAQKNQRLNSLTSELGQLKIDKELGELATQRYAGYLQQSLPAAVESSVTQYQLWLQELVESIGISSFSVDVKNRDVPESAVGADPLRPVFDLFRFEITRCVCSLRQLTELLFQLNQARILHRIKDLTITANTEGTGARATPTGELVVRMTIEVVCMRDADATRAFETEVCDNPRRTLAEYHSIVTRRDLFGLPNSSPEITAASRHEFEVGDNVRIELGGEDDDSAQELTYELLDVQYELADEDARFDRSQIVMTDGEVQMGRLPEGNYRFTVRLTDNGWPNKSDEQSFDVQVDPRPVEKVIPARPEARDTQITGRTTRDRVIPQIWIRIKPQDRTLMLVEGESFQLDNKTWTIEKILADSVLIDCDGEKLTYRIGSMLSDPERGDSRSAPAVSR
jgi:hypothetical protein